MTRAGDLRHALMCSVLLHGLLFFPGWIARPAIVDVDRGPVSVEIELFSETQLPRPEATVPAPTATAQQESAIQDHARAPASSQRFLEAASGHGAFSEAKPAIRNRPPAYPWLARVQGVEGTVVLFVRVQSDGHPSAVRVMQSSGSPILDQAAQRAVQQWEFIPAHRGGRAVRSAVELPIRFQLTSSKPIRYE